MKNILILTCFIFGGGFVLGQFPVQNREELFEDGQYFYNREDYEEAVYYYLKLYGMDTLNANYCFKVGECYINIPGKQAKAIKYLEYAVNHITYDYESKDIDENKAPLHSLFYLGQAYRMNNELDKALKAYNKFISTPYFIGNYNISIVENEMAATERAKTIKDTPIKVEFIPFSESVNTNDRELNPVISGDGKHMVFVRRLKFYDAVFYMTKTDSGWSEPVNINSQIISDGDFYPTCLSFDGEEMFMVNQKNFNQDIYITKQINGIWEPLAELGKPINSRSNESHAAISSDGQQLVFSSDRWGGRGNLDLYISKRNDDGSWGKPENLGPLINTEYNDNYAFFTNNDQTLYFSSQGHYNMGGYDVFYTNLVKGGWSIPFNIGYPISTTMDNIKYCPIKNGKELVLSKFDDNAENEDIFICKIISGVHLNEVSNDKTNVTKTSDNNINSKVIDINKNTPNTAAVIGVMDINGAIVVDKSSDGYKVNTHTP